MQFMNSNAYIDVPKENLFNRPLISSGGRGIGNEDGILED